MKREMTIPALKKRLSEMERKELEQLVCSLYKNVDLAEKSINLYILGKDYGRKLVRQYQEKLDEIFFPNNLIRAGFSVKWAKDVISEFKKICQDPELTAELKLYYVECSVEFTNTFGDINESFYDTACDMFHDVTEAVSENEELFVQWRDRIRRIVDESDGIGWGFHDFLVDEYYRIPWIEEMEEEEQ